MAQFVLASQSPRRKKILENLGYQFEILPPKLSEKLDKNLSLDAALEDLARQKASASVDQYELFNKEVFVLASDTMVIYQDHRLGKPANRAEAKKVMKMLSGNTHEVKSSICLMNSKTGDFETRLVTSVVRFREISDFELENYLDTEDWLDKAGSYGIQSQAGKFVRELDGSLENVIGLPIEETTELLTRKSIFGLAQRIQKFESKISTAEQRVQMLAVSKTKPVEMIEAAFKSGQKIFGENYVQELEKKYEALKHLDLKWHFIGGLQTNKVKKIIAFVELIQSVDRESLLLQIQKEASKIDKIQKILLQVDFTQKEGRSGSDQAELFRLARLADEMSNVDLCGLMTVPPETDSPEGARPYFKLLKGLQTRLQNELKSSPVLELSMGMSGDFQVAMEEGATIIRIGSALFGKRQ
ncbi:MAG: YggS family pyridoxal phosphate-dependent enzyme [Bdellovibrionales bacterium]